MMIDSCQGLDDRWGVPMQHTYVIANLRREKETSIDVLKKFYAYTAIIHSKNPLCCFHRINAGENFSAEAKKWMTKNGI